MAYVEAIETENGCELERLYPERFARPEVMNQIAVLNQSGFTPTCARRCWDS
jgi:hypothetical protein